ncbi:hypothetical protein [Isoptericola sp. NPDC056134]|uniref:hypothetical protein n=1 Tax=Isoptericola sp. NPDC056134 TaxID=3345723 RepID=UPI0035EFC23A
MDLDDARLRAVTVRVLQSARRIGLSTREVRDRRDEVAKEQALVFRQLDGYSRPAAPSAGVFVLEHHPPAKGRYRAELLAEQERLESERELLELAIRHLSDAPITGHSAPPGTSGQGPDRIPHARTIGDQQ